MTMCLGEQPCSPFLLEQARVPFSGVLIKGTVWHKAGGAEVLGLLNEERERDASDSVNRSGLI